MMSEDQMPKIDTKTLKPTDVSFMKFIEQQNIARVNKLKRIRRNNLITASVIGTGVLSIYFYSMFAVRQETFLDDFEEPAKVVEPAKQ